VRVSEKNGVLRKGQRYLKRKERERVMSQSVSQAAKIHRKIPTNINKYIYIYLYM